jgi:hypothetical protein
MTRRAPYRPSPMPEALAPVMRFWTNLVERAKPRGRCRGCAFRPGTAANRCGDVAAKVSLTVLHGGDFRCHHETLSGPVVKGEAPARQCRGFRVLIDRLRLRDEFARTLR